MIVEADIQLSPLGSADPEFSKVHAQLAPDEPVKDDEENEEEQEENREKQEDQEEMVEEKEEEQEEKGKGGVEADLSVVSEGVI